MRRVAHRQRLFRRVAALDGVLVGVDLAEVVGHEREIGDVLRGRRAVLVGARVDDHDAGAEVGEADPAALEHHVVLGHTPAEPHAARRPADGVFDDVRRDLYDLGLAIDPAAAVGEDVERLVALDEHAGALEHLECGAVDVVEVRVGEDLKAQGGVAPHPRLQIAFHRLSSIPRSLLTRPCALAHSIGESRVALELWGCAVLWREPWPDDRLRRQQVPPELGVGALPVVAGASWRPGSAPPSGCGRSRRTQRCCHWGHLRPRPTTGARSRSQRRGSADILQTHEATVGSSWRHLAALGLTFSRSRRQSAVLHGTLR